MCSLPLASLDTLILLGAESVARENMIFVLPSCINATSGPTKNLLLNRMIIRGPSSSPNSLAGLVGVFPPTLEILYISNSVLRPYSSVSSPNSATMDWSAFFNAYSSLKMVHIKESNLIGSLPSSIPSNIQTFDVSKNRLTGSVPSTIFSSSSSANVLFDASFNSLSGTLPPSLFTFPTGTSITTLQCILDNNAITGTIPNGWLAQARLSTLVATVTLSISLNHNRLFGPLPGRFFSVPTSPSSSYQVTFSALHNSIQSIPENLLADAWNVTQLRLLLDSNAISSSIPASLFVQDGLRMTILYLSLRNNSISGTLPPSLFSASRFETDRTPSFSILLDGNRISGSIPEKFLLMDNSPITSLTLDLSNNQLAGSLPSDLLDMRKGRLAPITLTLNVENNNISGHIPLSLFNTTYGNSTVAVFSSLSLNLRNNALSGSLPPSLFVGSYSGMTLIDLDFSANLLNGPIPSSLLHRSAVLPDAFTDRLRISFAHNLLSDSISGVLTEMALRGIGSLELDFSFNQLFGPLEAGLLVLPEHSLRSFTLMINGNQFSGSIPSNMLQLANWVDGMDVLLDFSHNRIEGTLPSTLLSATKSLGILDYRLDSNILSGSIPPTLFQSCAATSPALSLASNHLSGGFPETLLHSFPAYTLSVTLILDHNNLGGSISSSTSFNPSKSGSIPFENVAISANNVSLSGSIAFETLGNVKKWALNATSNAFTGLDLSAVMSAVPDVLQNFKLNLSHNQLSGSLSLPNVPSKGQTMSFYMNGNNFTSFSLPEYAGGFLANLDVSNNLNMVGTLPASLFNRTSTLFTLNASNTKLGGSLPDLGLNQPPYITVFDLSRTSINLCSSDSSFKRWAADDLTNCSLDVAAAPCRYKFASICFPTEASSCPESTRPSPFFNCINGTWTFVGDLDEPVVVIPGGSTTVVTGNLNTTSIILQGSGASVTVDGCVNGLINITIDLNDEELKKLGSKTIRQLILYDSDNATCDSLDNVTLILNNKDGGCRKVKATNVSSRGNLSALFSVDSSRCNLWWIILASVLGGVLVIAIIVIIMLVIFVPKVRVAFRPYSGRRKADAPNSVE